MTRIRIVLAVLAALALAGGLRAADTTTTGHGQLPAGFKKLGLSDDQTTKIRDIHASYRAKISELEQKLHELRKQELAEELQVLTDAQKERLKELATEKVTGEAPKTTPKPADNKNGGDNKNATNNGGDNKNDQNKNNDKDK